MLDRVMLTVDRVIDAPVAVVWHLLVDLDMWPRWGPTVVRAALDGPHVELKLHATGTVYTWLPVGLPFVVTEFDPQRSWAWTVAGVSATRHRVEPAGSGSRASIAVPWWAAPYLSVCAVALRRIETLALQAP